MKLVIYDELSHRKGIIIFHPDDSFWKNFDKTMQSGNFLLGFSRVKESSKTLGLGWKWKMVVSFRHRTVDGSFNLGNYLERMIYTTKRYRDKLPTSSLNVTLRSAMNRIWFWVLLQCLGTRVVASQGKAMFSWLICKREDHPFQCCKCESNDKMRGFCGMNFWTTCFWLWLKFTVPKGPYIWSIEY